MSALTTYRQSQIDYARRELRYALSRLDNARNQDVRDQAVCLAQIAACASRLAELAERYDVYLQGKYR